MNGQGTIRLIGLDPGLRNTGWGVVEQTGSKLKFLACGTVISDPKTSLAKRLLQLEQKLETVFDDWQPDYAAVENAFVNRDGVATMKLGQARAVSLLTPARRGIPVFEYAPNRVKSSVVGAGKAAKQQVAAMVKVLLPQADFKNDHAADALAVAITLAHSDDINQPLHKSMEAVL